MAVLVLSTGEAGEEKRKKQGAARTQKLKATSLIKLDSFSALKTICREIP